MAEPLVVHIDYEGDDQRRTLIFASGDSESLLVTQVGPDCFRLEESSLLGELEAYYHDVIRATPSEDGALRFQEIVSKSDLSTHSWLLSKEILESSECHAVLEYVMGIGGNWERAFGGLLLVHVPPAVAQTVSQLVQRLSAPSQP